MTIAFTLGKTSFRTVFRSSSSRKSKEDTAGFVSEGPPDRQVLQCQLISFAPRLSRHPAPSFDGHRVVFATNRPLAGKSATTMPGTTVSTSDLWMTERTASGWSAPVALGPEINTPADDDVPALTRDGTLYYGSSRPGAPGPAAIYRSRFVGGRFEAPELVPAPVTTTAGEMCARGSREDP